MNVEIGTEAPIFLFWEYLFRNYGILSLQCGCLIYPSLYSLAACFNGPISRRCVVPLVLTVRLSGTVCATTCTPPPPLLPIMNRTRANLGVGGGGVAGSEYDAAVTGLIMLVFACLRSLCCLNKAAFVLAKLHL
jgi:hypothetical protein